MHRTCQSTEQAHEDSCSPEYSQKGTFAESHRKTQGMFPNGASCLMPVLLVTEGIVHQTQSSTKHRQILFNATTAASVYVVENLKIKIQAKNSRCTAPFQLFSNVTRGHRPIGTF